MQANSIFPQKCLEDLVEEILLSRKITGVHRQQLQVSLLAEKVEDSDLLLIDRLVYGVRRGLLWIVE